MHRSFVWAAALLATFTACRAGATPLRLAVEDAVSRAAAANLEFGSARTYVDVAQAGLRRTQQLLPSNPYVTAGAQHSEGFAPNYSFTLSQEIEINGHRARRMAAATAEVERSQWDVATFRLNLAASVKAAFLHAQLSAERVTLAQQMVDLVGELAQRSGDRSGMSDLQRFEHNNIRIQIARAQRDLAAAEQERDRALLVLRQFIGLPYDQAVELVGAPDTRVREIPPAAELVERGLRQRPDLIALRHAVGQSDAQIAAARRSVIPNVTVSGLVSRFEGDTLVGGDLGVFLPVFDRKGADIDTAVAERSRASLQVQHLERDIEREVLEARRTCVVTGDDLVAHQQVILPRSEDNLALERRMYARGEVTASGLIGVAIDALTARRERVDAVQAYNASVIELERVIGGDPFLPPPAQQ